MLEAKSVEEKVALQVYCRTERSRLERVGVGAWIDHWRVKVPLFRRFVGHV